MNVKCVDPRLLGEVEIKLMMSSTGKTREEIKKEHQGFLALFPDGMANKVEFAKLFKAMCSRDKPNADPTKFVQFLFRLFDADSNGKVTFQEFIVASSFILIGDDPVEHLDKIFDVFDQDHDEKISRKELQYFIDALKELQDKHDDTDERVDDVLDNYDTDRSGFLDRHEFKDFFIEEGLFQVLWGSIAIAQMTVADD